MTAAKFDEPIDVWVVPGPEGHFGIFATRERAEQHAIRVKVSPDTVEYDVVRFEPMHEIDDGDDTPALAVPRESTKPAPPVVHRAPQGFDGTTPCCGRSPFDLPRTDRITRIDEVTCKGATAAEQEGARS